MTFWSAWKAIAAESKWVGPLELGIGGNLRVAKDVLTGRVNNALKRYRDRYAFDPPRSLRAKEINVPLCGMAGHMSCSIDFVGGDAIFRIRCGKKDRDLAEMIRKKFVELFASDDADQRALAKELARWKTDKEGIAVRFRLRSGVDFLNDAERRDVIREATHCLNILLAHLQGLPSDWARMDLFGTDTQLSARSGDKAKSMIDATRWPEVFWGSLQTFKEKIKSQREKPAELLSAIILQG